MNHKHNHDYCCAHVHVKYCIVCKVVHCLDCKQEWTQYPLYTWYTQPTTWTSPLYPNYPAPSYVYSSQSASNDLPKTQVGATCEHKS